MARLDAQVAVIGAGVVGCAVAHALAVRGVHAVLLEAEDELARGASGANSGILHTGFDSEPGTLETRMILRSAQLRARYLPRLGVPVRRCGARLRAVDSRERATVAALAGNAAGNGVEVLLESDGSLAIAGESLTDPAQLTRALAAGAIAGGAELRLGTRVTALSPSGPNGGVELELDGGERLRTAGAANCAGLWAEEVARMAGEADLEIYPRKGEFLVFEQPRGEPLHEILLPVPSTFGKGVLVFPTIDGHVIAGPTARDRTDKRDWSVERDARELILARAVQMFEPLAGSEPIAAYAGLRPAGRDCNYRIGPSRSLPGLVDVAAIRSTGLSGAFGIGEHVVALLAEVASMRLGAERELPAVAPDSAPPWWRAAAERSQAST